MTEYTPTTEEVREYVEVGGQPRPWEAPDDEADGRRAAAFDRWLAAHDAEVAANEFQFSPHIEYSGLRANEILFARADRIEREATNHKPNPELGSSETERGDR